MTCNYYEATHIYQHSITCTPLSIDSMCATYCCFTDAQCGTHNQGHLRLQLDVYCPRTRATYGSSWSCSGRLTAPTEPTGNSWCCLNTQVSIPIYSRDSDKQKTIQAVTNLDNGMSPRRHSQAPPHANVQAKAYWFKVGAQNGGAIDADFAARVTKFYTTHRFI